MADKLKVELDFDVRKARKNANAAKRGVKGIGDAAGSASSKMDSLGKNVSTTAIGMVKSFAGPAAAILAVQQGISAAIADMNRLAAANKAASLSLTQSIAAAGDLAFNKQIQTFLTTQLQGTGIGPAQAGAVFGAVRGATPLAPLGKVLSLTQEAARAKGAGFDPESFGQTLGQVSKVLPGLSTGQASNLAVFIQEATGRLGRRFGRSGFRAIGEAVATGALTPEQAVGFTLASTAAEQGTEPIEFLTAKLIEQRDFTAKQAQAKPGLAAFFRADPQQRLSMIVSDPSIRRKILGEQAGGFTAVLTQDPARLTRLAGAAIRGGDILGQRREQALSDQTFAEIQAVEEQEAQAERDEFRGRGGVGARALDIIEARERIQGVGAFFRKTRRVVREIGEVVGFDIDRGPLERATEAIRREESLPEPPPADIPTLSPLREALRGAGARVGTAPVIVGNVGTMYVGTPTNNATTPITRTGE